MSVRTLVAFLLAGLVVLIALAFCGIPVPPGPGVGSDTTDVGGPATTLTSVPDVLPRTVIPRRQAAGESFRS